MILASLLNTWCLQVHINLISLINISVFMSVPCWFYFYTSVEQLDIRYIQGFLVKCVSRHWGLTLMSKGEVVGVVKGSIGGRKARCSIKICLVSWEWGQRVRSVHSRYLIQSWGWDWGCWIWRRDRRVKI